MKLTTVFLSLILLFSNVSFAKEYGEYDIKKILTVTKTENGNKYGLDLQYIDLIINDLVIHAKNYPPKFDNEIDKQRAINDATVLSDMLGTIVNNPKVSLELLKRTSLLNSIGHNLDILGAAQKADSDFQRLLNQLPEDPTANFAYGVFLGNSNRGSKALPYLEKSIKNGNTDAYFALGMAYLTQKNSELALENFVAYQKYNLEDKSVFTIIEAIKSGNIRFKTQ